MSSKTAGHYVSVAGEHQAGNVFWPVARLEQAELARDAPVLDGPEVHVALAAAHERAPVGQRVPLGRHHEVRRYLRKTSSSFVQTSL